MDSWRDSDPLPSQGIVWCRVKTSKTALFLCISRPRLSRWWKAQPWRYWRRKHSWCVCGTVSYTQHNEGHGLPVRANIKLCEHQASKLRKSLFKGDHGEAVSTGWVFAGNVFEPVSTELIRWQRNVKPKCSSVPGSRTSADKYTNYNSTSWNNVFWHEL